MSGFLGLVIYCGTKRWQHQQCAILRAMARQPEAGCRVFLRALPVFLRLFHNFLPVMKRVKYMQKQHFLLQDRGNPPAETQKK
jgi:hypothetical protein